MSSCTAYKSTRFLAGLATLQIAVNSRPTPSFFHSRIPVRSQRAASPLISPPPPPSSSHGVRSHNLRQAPPASMPKKQESSILKHVERIRASRAAHSAKSPTIPWPSSTKRSTSSVACGPRVPQTRRPTPPQRSTTPPRQVSSTSVASKDSSESMDSSLQRELELVAALESNGAGFGNIIKKPRVNSSRVDRSISNHVRRIRTVSDCQRAIEAIPRPTPTTLRLRALNAKFKSKGIRTIDLEFIECRPQ